MKNNQAIKLLISLIIIYFLGHFLIGQKNTLSVAIKSVVPEKVKDVLKKTIYKNKYKKFENEKRKKGFDIVKNEILNGYVEFEEKDSGKITNNPYYFKGYFLPYASPYLRNKTKSFLVANENYLLTIFKSGRILKYNKNFLNEDIINKIEVFNNLNADYINNEKPFFAGIVAAYIENNQLWLVNLKSNNRCEYLEILETSLENDYLNFVLFEIFDLSCENKFYNKKNFNTYLKKDNENFYLQFEDEIFIIDFISKKIIKKLNPKDLEEVLLVENNYVYFKDNTKAIKALDIYQNKILNIETMVNDENKILNFNYKENLEGLIISKFPNHILQFLKINENNNIIFDYIDFKQLHNKIQISSALRLSANIFAITTLESPRIILLYFEKEF